MIHIVRNALDHGLETEDDRIQAGKSAVGNLSLEAGKDEDSFWIQIKDDGRGIDFTRIAARARAAGLPHETRSDLVTALLTDGISTRSTVTELSGRGVGTSAVKEAVDKLGGRIDLESSPGSGTSWRFVLPLSSLATMGLIS